MLVLNVTAACHVAIDSLSVKLPQITSLRPYEQNTMYIQPVCLLLAALVANALKN